MVDAITLSPENLMIRALFSFSTRCAPAVFPSARFGGLLALGLCALSPSAWAGRPMATDDAAVLEPGACQVEAWTERRRDERAYWLNPGCNPWGNTDFSLGVGRARSDEAGSATLTAWQIKHLLRPVQNGAFGLALAVGAERNRRVHNRALGDLAYKGIVTVPLLDDDWLMHANLGAVRERAEGLRRTRSTWALALDRAVAPHTRVSAETFGVGEDRAQWQLGARHELLPGWLQIDASVGSPWSRWSSGRVVTVGLVIVTDPLLGR